MTDVYKMIKTIVPNTRVIILNDNCFDIFVPIETNISGLLDYIREVTLHSNTKCYTNFSVNNEYLLAFKHSVR